MFSNTHADGGVYSVIVTAVIQETKYNLALNTNTDVTFTLTIVDPCVAAVINDNADTDYNREISDQTISRLGGSVSQTFYQFTDDVSLTYDLNNTNPSSILTGVSICGSRTYTLENEFTWLTTDWINGIITVEATLDN